MKPRSGRGVEVLAAAPPVRRWQRRLRIVAATPDFVGEMRANLADPDHPDIGDWRDGQRAARARRSTRSWSAVCCWPMRRCPPNNSYTPNACCAGLLAVQDPPARRRVGALEERRDEEVCRPTGCAPATSSKSGPAK